MEGMACFDKLPWEAIENGLKRIKIPSSFIRMIKAMQFKRKLFIRTPFGKTKGYCLVDLSVRHLFSLLRFRFESTRSTGKGKDHGIIASYVSSNLPSSDSEHDSLVATHFLESTSNQLTYYGLTTLVEKILDPGEVGVLFRNNHFGTVYNHVLEQGGFELCSLVTGRRFYCLIVKTLG
jgi:hypothetical protein